MARLSELGVRRITVLTPFLLELIKRRFPEFKVRVGVYAQVGTPRRAHFWEELGADAIVLESFSINRNFHRLAAIRQKVRCDLELIANHISLMKCPMQTYRQKGFAQQAGTPSVLFDAVAVILSDEGAKALSMESAAIDFVRDAFGHLKGTPADPGG